MKKILILLVSLITVFTYGCKKKVDENTLVVGASPTPHAEILNFAKPILKEKGITLKVREIDDYIIPNMALDAEEINANFMQHEPFLLNFNEKNKLKHKLISAGSIHFEPLGIYAGKSNDLKNIKTGAIIGIPNDPTNGARALWLLESNGIIKINKDKGFNATERDIIDNPKKVQIKPLEAVQIPLSLPDMDFAVINGNYALGAKITDKFLTGEDKNSEAAKTFANIIAVREADLNKPAIKTFMEVMQGEEVKKFITDKYKGVVLPVN